MRHSDIVEWEESTEMRYIISQQVQVAVYKGRGRNSKTILSLNKGQVSKKWK